MPTPLTPIRPTPPTPTLRSTRTCPTRWTPTPNPTQTPPPNPTPNPTPELDPDPDGDAPAAPDVPDALDADAAGEWRAAVADPDVAEMPVDDAADDAPLCAEFRDVDAAVDVPAVPEDPDTAVVPPVPEDPDAPGRPDEELGAAPGAAAARLGAVGVAVPVGDEVPTDVPPAAPFRDTPFDVAACAVADDDAARPSAPELAGAPVARRPSPAGPATRAEDPAPADASLDAAESAATAATAAEVGATERRTRAVGSVSVPCDWNIRRASVRRTALASGRCA